MPEMLFGNMPRDAGHLLLSEEEKSQLENDFPEAKPFLKKFQGSEDFTNGKYRGCIWVDEAMYEKATRISPLEKRFAAWLKLEELRAQHQQGDLRKSLIDLFKYRSC